MKQFTFAKKWFKKIEALRLTFLEIAKNPGTPIYVFDRDEVFENLSGFKNAFKKEGVDADIFYATKSNYYPGLLEAVVKFGEGIDVSSKRELVLAIGAKAKKIIYTGPAKTEKDFELIIKHLSKITVNLESVRELKLFNRMCGEKGVIGRCGVRIHTQNQAGWTKFGIPLSELKSFADAARTCKNLKFCGVHFHISFNEIPDKYLKTLHEICLYFKSNFSEKDRSGFEYIDMGGGFYPESFEGVYPWNPQQHTYYPNEKDVLEKISADSYKPRFLPINVAPIEKFAKEISRVYKDEIKKILPNAKLYCEPGRYISHSSMHILLRLIDVKGKNMGITDGGSNMVGWEKYQYCNYVPTFNLSNFTIGKEQQFTIYGSLCTPEDIWSYYLYTKSTPEEGDVILIPFQGAYVYTLAQTFIKKVPPVFDLKR